MKHPTAQLSFRLPPRRPAFTLVELAIAITLLGAVFAVLGQFLVRWEAARRAADDRIFALQTLECALERLSARREVQDDLLPAGAGERLRTPQLSMEYGTPDDAGLTAVTARLTWQNAEGQQVTPVVLTAWLPPVNAAEGGSP